MPSPFADAFAVAISATYSAVGDGALYTDSDGWNCDCTVIVNRNLTEYGEVAAVQGASAILSVRKSQVPYRPKRNDTFEIKETCESFRVDSVLASDDFEHQVIVV